MNDMAKGKTTLKKLRRYFQKEDSIYPDNVYRMRFLTNHDENSWYGTVFEQFGDAAQPFAVLTATMNGMPLIYSGQEAGLNKRLAFFDKDQIPWQTHPFTAVYSTLLRLKKGNKALWNGNNGGQFQRISTTNDEYIFAFVREKTDDKIFAVFNLTPGFSGAVLLDSLFCGTYTDVFTNDPVSFEPGNSVTLSGWEYHIYKRTSTGAGTSQDFTTPGEFDLDQNYPNPFNSATTISYQLQHTSHVVLKIYNALGQEVRTLINGNQCPGVKTAVWDGKDSFGTDMGSGIYIYKLEAGRHHKIRRMLLLR